MPKSDVYEDAERIRKLVYNFMKVNNPQYQIDPTYSSFPTPLPQTNGFHESEAVKRESHSRDGASKLRLSLASQGSEPPSERKSSAAPSATTGGEVEDEVVDFTGKSFQAAQELIVADLLRYADDEYVRFHFHLLQLVLIFVCRGLEIFTPFVNLPSRKLEDYYKAIRHPVSIKGVQKRIRGQHGRNAPTGVTDFKTWDALEEEMSFIWRNARDYNEDGSEMYELAGEFEVTRNSPVTA